MYRVGQRNEWMNKRRMEYMKTFQYDCKQSVNDFVQTSNSCVLNSVTIFADSILNMVGIPNNYLLR